MSQAATCAKRDVCMSVNTLFAPRELNDLLWRNYTMDFMTIYTDANHAALSTKPTYTNAAIKHEQVTVFDPTATPIH